MTRRSGALLVAVLASGAVGWYASRADEAKDDRAAPGWVATFTAKGSQDVRRDRFVALFVPAGHAAMPRLPAGPFRAVWKGELTLELKAEHTFSAEGSGKLTVTVNGAEALGGEGDLAKAKGKPITLRRGGNAVVVTYDSPAKGDAQVRLFWESEELRREPVPLGLVQQPATDDEKAAGELRRGREVIAERRCLACHKADVAGWVKGGGMPELEMDAPALTDIGGRLNPGWVARWLQDPAALRPLANMPRPFADLPRGDKAKLDPRARDMAAFLAGTTAEKYAEPAKEAVEAGTRLFARLGCIGCHLPPDREETNDDHGRLPLRDVAAKWRASALEAFLRQPDRHYAWVRMPNFNLSAGEAKELAAYLRSVKPRDVFPTALAGADAASGRKLVESAGCTSCHVVGDRKATVPHATAAAWDRLDAKKDCKGVAFELTAGDRAAVRALLSAGRALLARDTPGEFAARQQSALRCNACHKRDGHDDLWTQLKEENDGLTADLPPVEEKDPMFAAPQERPTLTWVGEKFRPEWLERLFAGKLGYKPRPFLRARMPAFPRRAGLLAAGLAASHGCPPKSPADPKVDEKLAEAGRLLAGKTKWGCVGCHMVGKSAAVGVFEAPGVNFDLVQERLRREYFDRWMWAPLRVEPGTKMPTVYNWGKPSPLPDLGGSADRQIDALWHYLMQGKKIRPPEASE